MKRNANYFLRNIGDTFFLYPSDELQDKKLVFLNETSAFLWDKLKEECSTDDLVKALLKYYNVEEKDAYPQVEGFIAFLFENGCMDMKDEC